ncbi:hypothetical protein [Neorhizobium sp. JUb45]|uniref:hypothetical protein n=1 Tax=Neorhizobium sp. JUb45 TaxID=2485113 RepID=UPI001048D15B|nr:hypothetical protein [Neorhizobium sp. JUb45]TCR04065.1 hypothetical protein EDF70_102161 [Neorhizobium sp. JUb45]
MARNFVATVKERGANEPCFVQLELHEDIGLKTELLITLNLTEGTSISDAKAVANLINEKVATLSLGK